MSERDEREKDDPYQLLVQDWHYCWISAQLWPNPWASFPRWADRFRSATLTCTDRSRQQSCILAVSPKSHKNCCQIPKSDILTMNDDHSFSCKLQALMVSETSILRVTVDFYRMNYLKWFLLKHVKTSHLLSFGSLHCRSLTLFNLIIFKSLKIKPCSVIYFIYYVFNYLMCLGLLII